MNNRSKFVLTIGLVAMFLGGCSMVPLTTDEIMIEPTDLERKAVDTVADKTAQRTKETKELYVVDDYGTVIPYPAQMQTEKSDLQEAISWLVEGSPLQMQLDVSYRLPIPRGTEVRGVTVENGVANIDFSPHFLTYASKDERRMIEAIVYTATSYPNVNHVTFAVNGTPLQKMPKEGFILDEPLSREIGVNLVNGDGVNVYTTRPVTIYYLKEDNGRTFYVPVTRRIDKQKDVTSEIVHLMKLEVPGREDLVSELNVDAKLVDAVKSGETLVLNFNPNIYTLPNKNVVSETLLDCLALSLTDEMRVKQIELRVDGKSVAQRSNGTAVSVFGAPEKLVNREAF
ncbi:MAG: GerMN domain-containing protein [Bacilli bacterium]